MFKYELHMHTSEGSRCAKSDYKSQLQKYANSGYTGVVLTDHFFNSNSSFLKDEPDWLTKVERFNEHYEAVKEYGKSLSLDVFFGFEFCSPGSHEQLIYGTTVDFLRKTPDLDKKSTQYLCDAVREFQGVSSLAHPFRQADYIDLSKPSGLEYCDCVEVYNYFNRNPLWNLQALELAQKSGKKFTAGSDAHSTEVAGHSGIATDFKITTPKQLADAILSDKTQLIIDCIPTEKSALFRVLKSKIV